MNTMYSSRKQSDGLRRWANWEMGRLLFHWSIVAGAVLLIVSLFFLTRILPREMVPILNTAFSLLGMGLAGFYLWVLVVGMPVIRRTFFGSVPMWMGQRRHKTTAPWFDQNGTMLWQRDGRGGWVRKIDVASGLARSASYEPKGSYR